MKLLLINPQNKRRTGFALTPSSKFPPLALGILAALTPDHWDVQIIDENCEVFEEIEDKEADFVGITSFTPNVFRAYEIAQYYKSKKTKVILGGIHASMLPDEALKYVDCVFKGEAEELWGKVIKDFEAGALETVYDGGHVDMENVPIARHDLFNSKYMFYSIQTTRGCPYNCEFCSVHTFNGNKHRLRPVKDIVDEIEQIPSKHFFFVDDNFYGYSTKSIAHATAILKEMLHRGIKKLWLTQASMNIGDDKKFLQLAHKAGCREVLIGVESDNLEQLKSSKKVLNARITPKSYAKKFRTIQSAGISILGAFIFGLDGDTPQSLRQRTKFIKRTGVDAVQSTTLTPAPGTVLYDRLLKEDRIIPTNYPEDWQKYHSEEVVIIPNKMSPEVFNDEMYKAWYKIYNKRAMRWRFIKSLFYSRNFETAMWGYVTNWQYRRIVFENGGYNPDIHPDKQKREFIEPGTHKKIPRPDDIF